MATTTQRVREFVKGWDHPGYPTVGTVAEEVKISEGEVLLLAGRAPDLEVNVHGETEYVMLKQEPGSAGQVVQDSREALDSLLQVAKAEIFMEVLHMFSHHGVEMGWNQNVQDAAESLRVEMAKYFEEKEANGG